MTEQLTQLVRDYANDAIIGSTSIPNEYNNSAIELVSASIIESFRGQIIGGGLSEVLNLFEGKALVKSHPVVLQMNNCIANDLISKFGINQKAAEDVAGKITPPVIEKLVKKTNDMNDSSFDLKNILAFVGGHTVNRSRVNVYKSFVAEKLAAK